MDSLCRIPLLARDLRREECVVRIADSLQLFADAVDDVFFRINERIDRNASETRSVAERVSACRARVEELTDTNKAIRIFSEAKYPAMDCFADYVTVFEKNESDSLSTRTETEIFGKPAVSVDRLQDKLEFYHVRTTAPNLYRWLIENVPKSGLGDVPDRVEYVTSLLQFNTERFVYGRDSIKYDNRDGAMQLSSHMDKKPALEEAPFSIVNKDQAAKKATDSYLYSPGTGEAPEMDMPLDLPHLSGVAEDMQFSSETGPTIAPSASFLFATDEREDAVEVVAPPAPAVEIEKPIVRNEEIATEPPKSAAPLPPPLPPPIAPLLDMTPETPERDSSEPDSSFIVRTSGPSKHSKDKPPRPSANPDDRASLMEAIRNAGGSSKARLRSTIATDAEQKNTSGSSGGDLMADLHAKLSMRRKGISGDRVKTADGSILGVISAMIPPPATTNAEASSAEDDWD